MPHTHFRTRITPALAPITAPEQISDAIKKAIRTNNLNMLELIAYNNTAAVNKYRGLIAQYDALYLERWYLILSIKMKRGMRAYIETYLQDPKLKELELSAEDQLRKERFQIDISNTYPPCALILMNSALSVGSAYLQETICSSSYVLDSNGDLYFFDKMKQSYEPIILELAVKQLFLEEFKGSYTSDLNIDYISRQLTLKQLTRITELTRHAPPERDRKFFDGIATIDGTHRTHIFDASVNNLLTLHRSSLFLQNTIYAALREAMPEYLARMRYFLDLNWEVKEGPNHKLICKNTPESLEFVHNIQRHVFTNLLWPEISNMLRDEIHQLSDAPLTYITSIEQIEKKKESLREDTRELLQKLRHIERQLQAAELKIHQPPENQDQIASLMDAFINSFSDENLSEFGLAVPTEPLEIKLAKTSLGETLLAMQVNWNQPILEDGSTPLHVAIRGGNIIVALYIANQCGIDFFATDTQGVSMLAAQDANHLGLMDYLRSQIEEEQSIISQLSWEDSEYYPLDELDSPTLARRLPDKLLAERRDSSSLLNEREKHYSQLKQHQSLENKIATQIIHRHFNALLFNAVTSGDLQAIRGLLTQQNRLINPTQKRMIALDKARETVDKCTLEELSSRYFIMFLTELVSYLDGMPATQLMSEISSGNVYQNFQYHMRGTAEALFYEAKQEIYPPVFASLLESKIIYMPTWVAHQEISEHSANNRISLCSGSNSPLYNLNDSDQNNKFFDKLYNRLVEKRLQENLPKIENIPPRYTWQHFLLNVQEALRKESQETLLKKQEDLSSAKAALAVCQNQLKTQPDDREQFVNGLLHSNEEPSSQTEDDIDIIMADHRTLPDIVGLHLTDKEKQAIYSNWVANVNAQTELGETIFHLAMGHMEAYATRSEVVNLLFEYSRFFNFNTKDNNGRKVFNLSTGTRHTVLHYLHQAAISTPGRGGERKLRLLLDIMKYYFDIDQVSAPEDGYPIMDEVDHEGQSLLHRLIKQDEAVDVSWLLTKGVSITQDLVKPIDYFYLAEFNVSDFFRNYEGDCEEAYVRVRKDQSLWHIIWNPKTAVQVCILTAKQRNYLSGELNLDIDPEARQILNQSTLSHDRLRRFYDNIEYKHTLSPTSVWFAITSQGLPLERQIYYALCVSEALARRAERAMPTTNESEVFGRRLSDMRSTIFQRPQNVSGTSSSQSSSSSSTFPMSLSMPIPINQRPNMKPVWSPMRADALNVLDNYAQSIPKSKLAWINQLKETIGKMFSGSAWTSAEDGRRQQVMRIILDKIIEADCFQTDCDLLGTLQGFIDSPEGQDAQGEVHKGISMIKIKARTPNLSYAQSAEGDFGVITINNDPKQGQEQPKSASESDHMIYV